MIAWFDSPVTDFVEGSTRLGALDLHNKEVDDVLRRVVAPRFIRALQERVPRDWT